MLLAKNKLVSAVFVLLSIFYLAQTIFIRTDTATLHKYHITNQKAVTLGLTIAIPYVIIWTFALVGYLRLHSYTRTIKGTKDGEAFRVINLGILGLSLWLPVTTIIAGLFRHYYNLHPSSTAGLVILNNYINIAILFPAFVIINRGSNKLLGLVKPRQAIMSPSQNVTLVYICLTALYLLLVLTDPNRYMAHGATAAAYYQPDWLIVTTIIIPRLIMWYFGIQAVQNIYMYRKKVKGSIYKLALRNLSTGIGGVVLAVIILRIIQSLASLLSSFSLMVLLLVIYVLLIFIGFGYVMISRGAKNLQRLEEL